MASALNGLGFLLFALLLHYQAGSFQSEFGRYPDEGMHYVTGLMLHDFILSPSHWPHPMAFAQNFYLHYPKVGLLNWPPVFPTLQALWELAFGVSRVSLLVFMMFLNALLAWCVQHNLRARLNPILAILAGLLVIASPLSQAQASMVMAEIPLALFSLLALLAFTQFLDSGRTRDALWFGTLTAIAIMTKGNAWVIFLVVPAALLLTGRLRLLLTRGWWLAISIIALVCGPYTLYSMRIVTQGWDGQSLPPTAFLTLATWKNSIFIMEILGPACTALALLGLAARVRIFQAITPKESFWLVMGLYGFAILGFHVAVPTSIEPRKLYQITPVMAIFAAAGLDFLARRFSLPPAPVAVAGLALFLFSCRLLPPFIPGFGTAVEQVISRADSAGAVVLISSEKIMDDSEAALIAEWTERDRQRGTFLARGNKLLATAASVDHRLDFVPVYNSPDELRELLNRVPVAYVIVHTAPVRPSLGHRPYRFHADLQRLLEAHPEAWENLYHSTRSTLGDEHRITLYRNRRDLRGLPIRYSVDLSKKIGRQLSTP